MDYVSDLRQAIASNHGCEAHLEEIVPVAETRNGGVFWEGDVAVFLLEGHPRARRCFAWGTPSDDGAEQREITTVLEIPPVTSAGAAVKAAMTARARSGLGA
jgi:hypothetical protein